MESSEISTLSSAAIESQLIQLDTSENAVHDAKTASTAILFPSSIDTSVMENANNAAYKKESPKTSNKSPEREDNEKKGENMELQESQIDETAIKLSTPEKNPNFAETACSSVDNCNQDTPEESKTLNTDKDVEDDLIQSFKADSSIVGSIEDVDIPEAEACAGSEGADNELENVVDNKVLQKKRKSKGDDEESKDAKKSKVSKDDDGKDKDKGSELKGGNMRKNIREVMDETKLDEATLAAQMLEKERLRRVQEQLKAERDIRRQMRVLSKFEKDFKGEERDVDFDEKPNTVVVKLSTGSTKVLDLLKMQNTSVSSDDEEVSLEKFANLSKNLDKPQMVTSSVSIVPVPREPKLSDQNLDSQKMVEVEPSPKKEHVVTISSESENEEAPEEDDDDCIVISEGDESEPEEEDTANSGMHTNDAYNVPDAQGRVLVNVGHPDTDEDVFLAPQIARIIKPHQIGGVRFLFDNIVESLGRYKTSDGFGCILAHSMGLGKTLQVISFCDVFLRYTDFKTVLCIMPINTLQNWVAEFNMWLPLVPEDSSLAEDGEVVGRKFPLFVLNDNQKTLSARSKVVAQWHKEGGVLLMGYELYRQLSFKKLAKTRGARRKKNIEPEEDLSDDRTKDFLENIYFQIVSPGPDLVICDEGHRIKNSHASTSLALKQIRSKRRVVLTGYPLQNNLLEYWCMVDFVRPNYLGTKTEFSNMFERPIQNGQCIDSTPQDVKLMRYRAHVLHSLLQGFVQRRSHSVLQQSLPKKYEFVILLKLTPFQKKLYSTFMNEVVRTKAIPNPLKAFAVCCKIWNHPDILYNFLKKRAGEEDIDLDLDEAMAGINTPSSLGSVNVMGPVAPPQAAGVKPSRPKATSRRSQNKEPKAPRKSKKASTSPHKKPLIAAVPPNIASNTKSVADDSLMTQSNNQDDMPTLDSYNDGSCSQNEGEINVNNQHSQGYQTGDNFVPQVPSRNQSYNSEYNQQPQQRQMPQDYQVQQSGNAEYSNSYQQNYADNNNYYQDDYQSMNYWPASDSSSNYYPNNSPSAVDEYYQDPQASETQFSHPSSSYHQPQSTNLITGTDTYMGKSNQNQSSFNQSYNSYDMGNQMYTSSSTSQYSEPEPQTQFANESSYTDVPPMQQDYASTPSYQNQNRFQEPSWAPAPRMAKPRGRPPLTQGSRSRGANMNPRSGVAGRRPRLPNPGQSVPSPNIFQPGLAGGAPARGNTLQNTHQPNSGNNQMNTASSFIDSFNNSELWNPSDDMQYNQHQSYGGYDNIPPQNHNQQTSFIQNVPQPHEMEGSTAGSRNLVNELANNEIFNPQTSNSDDYSQNSQQNLYIDNYNTYLDDINLPGSSFMGLLQGEEPMENLNVAIPQNSKENANNVARNDGPTDSAMNKNGGQISRVEALSRSSQMNYESSNKRVENTSANGWMMSSSSSSSSSSIDAFPGHSGYEGGQNTSFSLDESASVPNQGSWSNYSSNENSPNFQYGGRRNYAADDNTENLLNKLSSNQSLSLVSVNDRKRELTYDATSLGGGKNSSIPSGAIATISAPPDRAEKAQEFLKPSDSDLDGKVPASETTSLKRGRERDIEPGIPYDWTNEYFKDYEPGKIDASAKMVVLFSMLDEIVRMGDRLLLFSQSLFTLNLIEEFLHLTDIPGTEDKWAKNKSYFRLDGSTSALEREKLINEFNSNSNFKLFLVSTRAGSLGINLVGANRVIVFDASWNPCHDTQAVCRVYRYGQQKSCYVYRFVMDHCLEKKIYDRQINKQGMSDRIVDECNPDAHLTMKDVTSLCYDNDDEVTEESKDFKDSINKYEDVVIQKVIAQFSYHLSKEPFIHESLLVDRKDSKLSSAEKRMAQRGYELEKQANIRSYAYSGLYNPQIMPNRIINKPIGCVRPIIADNQREPIRKWIPAEVWQRQGMSAQEMTLPMDVVIPTSTTDNRSSIVLKAGQKVMVLKSPKGIYMQLENGKIVAIKTAAKPSPLLGSGKSVGTSPPPQPVPQRQNPQIRSAASGLGVMMRPGVPSTMGRRDQPMTAMRPRFPRPTMSSQGTQSSISPPLTTHQAQYAVRHGAPRPMQNQRFPLARQPLPKIRHSNQMPSSTMTSATNKQVFGPHSAVTISVANNKKIADLQPQSMAPVSHPREGEKPLSSHTNEVAYDEYDRGSPGRGYNDYSQTRQSPSSNLPNPASSYLPARTASRNSATLPPRPPQYEQLFPPATSSISDTLRHKKDINLTHMSKPNSQQGLRHPHPTGPFQQNTNSSRMQPQPVRGAAPAQYDSRTRPPQPQIKPGDPARVSSNSCNLTGQNQNLQQMLPNMPNSQSISIFPVSKKSSSQLDTRYTQQHPFPQQQQQSTNKGGNFSPLMPQQQNMQHRPRPHQHQQQLQQQSASQQQQFQRYYQGNVPPQSTPPSPYYQQPSEAPQSAPTANFNKLATNVKRR